MQDAACANEEALDWIPMLRNARVKFSQVMHSANGAGVQDAVFANIEALDAILNAQEACVRP